MSQTGQTRKVVITGGTGFIGYHLCCAHLERGDEVLLLDNLFKNSYLSDPALCELLNHKRVQWQNIDLSKPIDEKILPPKIDIAYHLAAINGTRLFYEMPFEVASLNLKMTLHFLEALEKVKVESLIYTSTSEVYAQAEELGLLSVPTSEQVPVCFVQPTNSRFSYGTSKFMGEFLFRSFGEKFKIPTRIIRYHNIYGPRMGDKHVIPEFIERVLKGENPFRVFGGDETRAFCYVSDAVEATMAIAGLKNRNEDLFHVGNNQEEIEIRSLAERVFALMGKKPQLKEEGRRVGSVSRRCPDISLLRKATGFLPRVKLDCGLQSTISFYKSQFEKKRVAA